MIIVYSGYSPRVADRHHRLLEAPFSLRPIDNGYLSPSSFQMLDDINHFGLSLTGGPPRTNSFNLFWTNGTITTTRA